MSLIARKILLPPVEGSSPSQNEFCAHFVSTSHLVARVQQVVEMYSARFESTSHMVARTQDVVSTVPQAVFTVASRTSCDACSVTSQDHFSKQPIESVPIAVDFTNLLIGDDIDIAAVESITETSKESIVDQNSVKFDAVTNLVTFWVRGGRDQDKVRIQVNIRDTPGS